MAAPHDIPCIGFIGRWLIHIQHYMVVVDRTAKVAMSIKKTDASRRISCSICEESPVLFVVFYVHRNDRQRVIFTKKSASYAA